MTEINHSEISLYTGGFRLKFMKVKEVNLPLRPYFQGKLSQTILRSLPVSEINSWVQKKGPILCSNFTQVGRASDFKLLF